MVRAQSFFGVLYHDPEMQAQHMDGLHFVTESLLRLWSVIDNNHQPSKRNPAFKALYATQQDAIAYENIMKSEVFDIVHANYILAKQYNLQLLILRKYRLEESVSASGPTEDHRKHSGCSG